MRILDRYIFKSVLGIFLGCLAVFISLYVIIDIFSHLDEILKQQINIGIMSYYYLAYLPIIFVRVAAIACLLATLYTFGKMSHQNEIIAMRSAGLSIFQIAKTVIIFGLMISAVVFWINDKSVPSSLSLVEKIKDQMEASTKETQEKESAFIANLSVYGLKNRLFFIKKFYISTNTMENIIILEDDEYQNLSKKIVANKGIYKDGLWRFYQTITYNFNKKGQIVGEPRYLEEEIMAIPETPRDFLNQGQRPEFMTIAQLDEYIWRLSKSGATTAIRNFKVELYQRFTAPFTAVVVILLGIPFALKMKKRATGLSSVGIAIMVGFLYYVVNAIGLALGNKGILTPALSASLSHIIALLASLYLIRTSP